MATLKKKTTKKSGANKASKPARAATRSSKTAPKSAAAGKATKQKVTPTELIEKSNNHRKPQKLAPFLKQQREKLLNLRDGVLDSMSGVAKDSLRSRAEGSEASAFGMHQADAGSDAYDRDFALSLLSQEQDALYEIEQALKRIDAGTYGTCEMSGKAIPRARLEAIPFARFTVECQSQLEKVNRFSRNRQPVASLFGLTEDEEGEDEESTIEKE